MIARGARAGRAGARRGHPAAVALGLLLLVHAATVSAADPGAGRKKAAACVACHGESGISVQPGAPHLAGQPQFYLAEQLRLYRSGKRPHEVMRVIAKPLSDSDIDDLAAWFAAIELRATLPQ